MGEIAILLAVELGTLALLLCAGLPLAAWLLPRDSPARLALAPALGLAALAALLLTAQWVAGSRLWARPLILLIAVAATVATAAAARRGLVGRSELAELRWAALAGVWPLVVSTWPYVKARTAGPTNLQFMDAWFYVPIDRWLQDNPLRMRPDPDEWLPTQSVVSILQDLQIRAGFDAIDSALASFAGLGPDLTLTGVDNTLYAVAGITVYGLARVAAELARPLAVFAALVATSSALLTLPFDSSGPNLAGVILFPLALFLAGGAFRRDSWRGVVVAGVVVGGLVGLYSELVPMLAVTLTLLAVYIGALARTGQIAVVGGLRGLVLRAVAVGLVAVLTGPVGFARMVRYLAHLEDSDFSAGYDRGLDADTVGGWLFGVIHLYEVPRLTLFSPLKHGVAVGVPVLLLALSLAGIVLARPLTRAFLVIGSVGALAFAAYAEYRLEWNYGAHRSLTVLVPFAAIALAAGIGSIGASRRGLRRPLVVGLSALAAVVVLLPVLRSQLSLVDAQVHSRTDFERGTRDISGSVEDAGSGRTFVEGADAGYPGDSHFDIPAALDQIGSGDARPSYDPSYNAVIVGGGSTFRPPEESYSPEYELVVTRFGGVRSDRMAIAEAGPYRIMRRAPVDVAVVGTAWAVDEDTIGRVAIPWIRQPFGLWISSPNAVPATLRLSFEGSEHATATVNLAHVSGRPIAARLRRTGRSLDVCAELRLAAGRTAVGVAPTFAVPVAQVGGLIPDVRSPPVDRRLSLVSTRVETGGAARCGE